MSDKPVRIVISGYYGCGNTGDEAVLAGIVVAFQERVKDRNVEFVVLSADVEDTFRRHGLKAVNRMNRKALVETFQNSDMFISGGGSLLQDSSSLRSLIYYLWVINLAKRMGLPVVYFAQGIGPLHRRVSQWLTRWVTNKVNLVTVRDPASSQLLKDIGVNKPEIILTADPAFALVPEITEKVTRLITNVADDTEGPIVIFALRTWDFDTISIDTFAKTIQGLVSNVNAKVVLLPMQLPGDLNLATDIAVKSGSNVTVATEQLSPRETLGLISQADVVVAMRLHALIFAGTVGTPVLGLEYDPKVAELMSLLGQTDRCLSMKEANANLINNHILQLLSNSNTVRSTLLEKSSGLRDKALSGVDSVMAILNQ